MSEEAEVTSMRINRKRVSINAVLKLVIVVILVMVFPGQFECRAQVQTGEVRGSVRLAVGGDPVHNARVTIVQLQRSTETSTDGTYVFRDLPPGRYDISATLERLPDMVIRVELTPGSTLTVNFDFRLDKLREQVTVTASGREETTLNAMASVNVIGSIDLARRNAISLGEALENELGVAKRSFGPGNSRPVIRGFDGDRVLVLQEGVGIGGLGFQSGDHAEPLDLLSQDRVEVVKGPATLLYGSNAIGGVVNAISGHEEAHPGVRGYITTLGSTTNDQFGGSAGIEVGTERWLLWANGGGQRAGDYRTPLGTISNSFVRAENGSGGVGYFREKGFLSLNYTIDRRNYGIPYTEEEEEEEEGEEGEHHHGPVRLNPHRSSIQVRAGLRDLAGAIRGGNFTLQYNDYQHSEIEIATQEVGTRFNNRSLLYRAVFDQQSKGRLAGSFGVSGLSRDFKATGDEALAPPTSHTNFAAFGLQSVNFDRVALQFGGRIERNAYNPTGLNERTFTGFSGSSGIRIGLSGNMVFVGNYTHSYRAPALEELYNNGPHPGNLTYEIGNSNLTRERSDGIDLSVRHSSARMRAEANYFIYSMRDFIYLAPTGETEDELIKARYAQGSSRFTGIEGRLDLEMTSNIWLLSSLDYVNAELTQGSTPLPRIPPLRARIGIEAFLNRFRLNPELVLARDQTRIFSTETPTAGYAVINLNASYTVAGKHTAHVFSVNGFNLSNRLYRNHLSFIKEFAPEIGRGVRASYTLRFY